MADSPKFPLTGVGDSVIRVHGDDVGADPGDSGGPHRIAQVIKLGKSADGDAGYQGDLLTLAVFEALFGAIDDDDVDATLLGRIALANVRLLAVKNGIGTVGDSDITTAGDEGNVIQQLVMLVKQMQNLVDDLTGGNFPAGDLGSNIMGVVSSTPYAQHYHSPPGPDIVGESMIIERQDIGSINGAGVQTIVAAPGVGSFIVPLGGIIEVSQRTNLTFAETTPAALSGGGPHNVGSVLALQMGNIPLLDELPDNKGLSVLSSAGAASVLTGTVIYGVATTPA